MNFKKDYEDLYNQWKNEIEQVNLIDLAEETFLRYQEIKSKINDFNLNDNDPIKIRLIKEFRKNFNYLFDDFLHVRKIKIINSAMNLEEINLNHLIEHEKKFYQNLVGSFKTYDKINIAPLPERPIEKSISEESSTLSLEKDNLEVPVKIEPIKSDSFQEETDYQYTLIRMVKNSPPLVGVDMKNYGPFEKEDVINMPYKNAIILINEKFAEKIDLP